MNIAWPPGYRGSFSGDLNSPLRLLLEKISALAGAPAKAIAMATAQLSEFFELCILPDAPNNDWADYIKTFLSCQTKIPRCGRELP